MKSPLSNLTLFTFLYFLFVIVKADEVPSALWNIKGNALHISSAPAFGESSSIFDKTIKEILDQNSNILVYALHKMSLEDFSTSDQPESSNSTLYSLQKYLDSQQFIFLSAVKNPLDRLHEIHCGVQEIMVDQNVDENVLQSVSLAFGQSCVVILHVTDIGIFGTKEPSLEDIKKVFQPDLEKSSKDVVGLFTSSKSSWSGSNADHHLSRNILQSSDTDPNFINITGCIYMYAENVTVNVGKGNNTIALTMPPDTAGSSCDNQTATLQLAFKSSGDVTGVTVKFTFRNIMGSWVTDATIVLTGDKVPTGELPTYSKFIEAPMKKSFNCGKLKLRTKNNTDIVVTMKGFQVQPFPPSDKFSDSFDCVPFFTVPIWMGVFVSVLFIVIINVGIYALFSVHTMDRFDDPKKKTISVAVGGD